MSISQYVYNNSNNNASNDETVSCSLQYLSDEYDDLSASNYGVVDQLKALSRRLNKLSADHETARVGNAIDEVEEYSYQFNVKIIGLPEKSSETAAETSALCVKLFQEMGAEVFLSDIDIAHCVPSRQQNGAPKPVICKSVRRLAKASVMEARQSASQVNPSNIGLSADSYFGPSLHHHKHICAKGHFSIQTEKSESCSCVQK